MNDAITKPEKPDQSNSITAGQRIAQYWIWFVLIVLLSIIAYLYFRYSIAMLALVTLIPMTISAAYLGIAGKRSPVKSIVYVVCLHLAIPLSGGTVTLFWYSLILQVFAWMWIQATDKPQLWASPIAAASLILALGGGWIYYYENAHEFHDLKEQFPFVSLEQRLAYEKRYDNPGHTNYDQYSRDVDPEIKIQDHDLDHLDFAWYDQNVGYSQLTFRQQNLLRIHSDAYRQFVGLPEFGIKRMRVFRPEQMPELTIKNVVLKSPTTFWPGMLDPDRFERFEDEPYLFFYEFPRDPWSTFVFPYRPDENEFLYHFTASQDFLDANSFGLTGKYLETMGFVEHAFHFAPPGLEIENQRWQLTQLQLVSIDRFEIPRAYVLDSLPRMDQLNTDNVDTRKLNDFELAALKKLQAGQQVVFKADNQTVEMVGALRSRGSCMECHSAKKNELLGAFTYRFEPYRPKTTNQ